MRVIAGKAKGHRLKAPRSRMTRPTSNLVREAIFSALASLPVDLSGVLDLYAGSGALGVEALSRGAARCDFVERSPVACAIIRENLMNTRLEEMGHVYCMKVERALLDLNGPYTLVLIDPPYRQVSTLAVVGELSASPAVIDGAHMAYEHAHDDVPGENVGNWLLLNRRCHGDSAISIYTLERRSP